jgi:hypothetical protein
LNALLRRSATGKLQQKREPVRLATVQTLAGLLKEVSFPSAIEP